MTTSKKNIVIVGASSAGHQLTASLLKTLPSTHRILLIDRSPIAFWPPASLRAAVLPGWESKVYRQLTQETVFGQDDTDNKLIKATVLKVADGSVELDVEFEGSKTVPYDALAIATGASQLFPMRPQSSSSTPESVESAFRQMQTSIASAKRILVIGGGPTGIEFTGEVLAQHPDKSITLVHRNTTLLDDRFPAKLAAGLETQLRNKGVELLLGQHLDVGDGFNVGAQEGEKEFVTREGKVIKADFVFLAKGNQPNTELIRDVDPSALTPGGLIKVNEYLQIKSSAFPHNNVFASGDCAETPGWRSIVTAEADALTVATNISTLVSGSTSLKKHKQGLRAMVVPLGPSGGGGFINVPLLGDTSLPAFMVGAAKGKTLLTERFHGRFVAQTV